MIATDTLAAIAAAIGGAACAILALRQPPDLPYIRAVERDILALRAAAERRRRNRRIIIWLCVICVGLLLLSAFALTDTGALR